MIISHHSNRADLFPTGPHYRFRTRRRLLDALLHEALGPEIMREAAA
jgi:hypothetical protein